MVRIVYAGAEPVELADGTVVEPGVPVEVSDLLAHGTPAEYAGDGERVLVRAAVGGLLDRPDFALAATPAPRRKPGATEED